METFAFLLSCSEKRTASRRMPEAKAMNMAAFLPKEAPKYFIPSPTMPRMRRYAPIRSSVSDL